jgi:hypothetical protein
MAQSGRNLLTQQQFKDYEQSAIGELSDADLRYLKDNRLRVPDGLNQVELGGLHNVIHNRKLHSIAVS